VTNLEVKDDKLMLTHHGDFITLGGKSRGWTKKQAGARLRKSRNCAGRYEARFYFKQALPQIILKCCPHPRSHP